MPQFSVTVQAPAQFVYDVDADDLEDAKATALKGHDTGDMAPEDHWPVAGAVSVVVDAIPSGTLRDVLPPEWVGRIEAGAGNVGECGDAEIILGWHANTECPRAIRRVIDQAEEWAQQWPDAREGIYSAALKQINVLAWG